MGMTRRGLLGDRRERFREEDGGMQVRRGK